MPAKRKRDMWIIEFTSPDTSRDQTVAYRNRDEAVKEAAIFIKYQAQEELEQFEWEPEDEAPKILNNILRSLDEGKLDDAIVEWLDFQSEYDPEEQIAIGPSGSVSNNSHDFARFRK